ncbi:MAG TPA: CinA family protein [Ferruginibacter sp.]|jgi:PncC family amidohydrolase|nr:CinA family protein [Ferruginibacter sp.]
MPGFDLFSNAPVLHDHFKGTVFDEHQDIVQVMFKKELIQEIADRLSKKQYSIAVAESVTAGLIQAALASAENASVFFQGGITAYNAKQKYTHLQVDLLHAASCNCVSPTVAEQMAQAVSRSFSSDWGIAITGYASPLPGHDMNPLYAYYAISFKGEILRSEEITAVPAEAIEVQLKYVHQLLQGFLNTLKTKETLA